MKKIISLSAVVSLAFVACQEQIPNGLILTSTASKDTTYVAAAETPQAKVVVIEELTGATCSNCPKGTEILKGFVESNPGRIVLTGIHSGFLSEPPAGAHYDFRNADADALKFFFNEGEPSKPSACFDRVQATSGNSAGKYFISKGQTGADWIAMLPTRLSKTTPVNIHLQSEYNTSTSKVDVKVKVAFTSAVNEKVALSMYVLESGRKDKQYDIDLGVIENYKFNHIFRKMITGVGGELILDSLTTKEAGRVLEKSISFEPNTTGVNGWDLDSCTVVGIVHKMGSSKEVLHAQEVKLR